MKINKVKSSFMFRCKRTAHDRLFELPFTEDIFLAYKLIL
ncbi:Uncharacterized protein dnm_054090 [Desulfonema magnum]|uniref:Uncharacterized protein n=1 Tax=Desulfonema magnum TaxID=45655 RepID=A0A975BPA3_9BACT|nr:Uncharacterized protein dnm_054090 [Desulfonema magnum]